MPQVFNRSANPLAYVVICAVVGLAIAGFFAPWFFDRSPYSTLQNTPKMQPVPFSHRHHANELGIDCRYCHTSVETSSFAGIPPTETCMTCHSQIWKNAPILEPIRASFRENKPMQWTRVDEIPQFVYFDHSIHVAKGIGCTTCHGPVGTMTITWAGGELKMAWCLNCHRHPEKYVRPKDKVFDVNYAPPRNQEELGRQLVKEYGIYSLTDCVTCHR
jgi:Cytochrome c7 and related cytochrome c/Class III cytochrome C family